MDLGQCVRPDIRLLVYRENNEYFAYMHILLS